MFDNLSLFVSTISRGISETVFATVGGIALTIVLSFAAGLGMLSRHLAVRAIARTYSEIWRGTSEVVQLLWIFFVLPVLVGIQLVPIWAGILVLGLNHGAYGAHIVRGAVRSVPAAQVEAAVAISLSPAQRMRRVILPQALVEMIPPFTNLFVQLLKGSALLLLIRVHEITYQAKEVALPRHTDQALLIWTVVLVCYFALAMTITGAMRLLERRAAVWAGRPAPRRRGPRFSMGAS